MEPNIVECLRQGAMELVIRLRARELVMGLGTREIQKESSKNHLELGK